ncbi:phage replisome organizer N-terminal domain-containing protein [Clostridium botulinum]|uniref:phage replisome organizer N-terminal domain-containing protein n=1 Tax=Clostridium botulinum TaxID=1491 RepID=UPI001C9ACF8D|nr:phage replisome organizer N-terminal domain-containing protein [Clostridium botulinum]MBY6846753.1 phage replisome organizer N-terminal domain-containing protein [Clostridium botulinum]
MGEVKWKVKWIKIVTDIFDDEKILLIENMPEADSIIVIWFKLLCLAGKMNNSGVFMLNEKIAYTDEMLATIFRRPLNTVRLAINTFQQFGMIEVIDNVITIPNWSKHQTLDQLEERKEYMREYMKGYREKQKLLATGECKVNSKTNGKVNSKANVNPLDIEEDKDIDIEEDIDNTTEVVSSNKLQPIVDKWNSLNLNKLIAINKGTIRYKLLNARIKEYGIDNILKAIENIETRPFLKGQNKKGWTITFDWFVKPNNFIKVLEGNYTDKEGVNGGTKQDTEGSKKQEYDFSKYEG